MTAAKRSSPGAGTLPADYAVMLDELKKRIRAAQLKAALAVNHELVLLYWQLGRQIITAQQTEGWGAKIIQKLSTHLSREFPEMKGFSPRNLKYMRAFAEAWPDEIIVQQLAAQIPWFHSCILLDKIKDIQTRQWYTEQTIANGWSRNVLAMQIETRLHEQHGKGVSNFSATLPKPQSDLIQNLLKDPYNFDFLGLGPEAHERETENALIVHIRKFLLELGAGFAFVGQQYHLEVGDEDFYIDLLFYHTRLHCYVVIELKSTKFKPEYAGKLNFNLSAVDDLLRTEGDAPTIGLILCRDKNRMTAEYALRDINKPIGISNFDFNVMLPEHLRTALPSIEDLERKLSEEITA